LKRRGIATLLAVRHRDAAALWTGSGVHRLSSARHGPRGRPDRSDGSNAMDPSPCKVASKSQSDFKGV
jgi:hypothetical protein